MTLTEISEKVLPHVSTWWLIGPLGGMFPQHFHVPVRFSVWTPPTEEEIFQAFEGKLPNGCRLSVYWGEPTVLIFSR